MLNLHQEIWLQALESGDYHQSFLGFLHSFDPETGLQCFDPLGVACHILDKNKRPTGRSVFFTSHKPNAPAHPAAEKLGLTQEGEFLLQGINDQEKYPFQVIAHIIRSRPELFFTQESMECPIPVSKHGLETV